MEYLINQVEKLTGVSKESLRKWEERYHFPSPRRDTQGNRLYSETEIARIAEVKHLTNNGLSASKSINAVINGIGQIDPTSVTPDNFATSVLNALKLNQYQDVQSLLEQQLPLVGLASFITECLPGIAAAVGDSWSIGKLSIYQEHMYTEVVQQLLRGEISKFIHPPNAPIIVLATPPGEIHSLGILMVHILLILKGINCISLGTQVPSEEIAKAAETLQPTAIGLSFSAAFAKRDLRPFLSNLRPAISISTEIWLGGEGARRATVLPDNSKLFRSLVEFNEFLSQQYPAAISGIVGSPQ